MIKLLTSSLLPSFRFPPVLFAGLRLLLTILTGLTVSVQVQYAQAANIDILLVLDKNGTRYTLQQTISPDGTSVDVTLADNIKQTEIIFSGPDREIYNERYLHKLSAESARVFTIESGSAIIRYQHDLPATANANKGSLIEFQINDIAVPAVFSAAAPVAYSITVVLPDDLEFIQQPEDIGAVEVTALPRMLSWRAGNGDAWAFPVRYQRADQDNDGVANSYDLCPDSPADALVDRRGCEPDVDLDGVTDIIDTCPGSSVGASVDDKGCEPDADRDGLADRYDQCDDTPEGFAIGGDGCNRDTDNDGIPDTEDQCPNSEANEPVMQTGCSLDFDNDGVPNFRDQCEDTDHGRSVGMMGCEVDHDADGVADRLDVCEQTPAGIAVDQSGCVADSDGDTVPDYRDICLSQPVSGTEKQAINTLGCKGGIDTIVIPDIEFVSGSSYLTAEVRIILDRAAQAIAHHQNAAFEVAAHTSAAGKSSKNLTLSTHRADIIRQYLMVRRVSPNQLTSKGYGETVPLQTGTKGERQALNERVELKLLQTE